MKNLRQIKTRYEALYYFKETEENYTVKTPEIAVTIARKCMEFISEELWAFYFNVKNKFIYSKLIVKGGYNVLICKPADILVPALQINARNFIVAHCHPSDDCSPSPEDIIFTKKVSKACEYIGLQMLDHIILSKDNYYSFKKNNVI